MLSETVHFNIHGETTKRHQQHRKRMKTTSYHQTFLQFILVLIFVSVTFFSIFVTCFQLSGSANYRSHKSIQESKYGVNVPVLGNDSPLRSRQQFTQISLQNTNDETESFENNRRKALLLIGTASSILIPSISLAAFNTLPVEIDPLRCAPCGQWKQLSRSIPERNNSLRPIIVSASFCTYLTRFLIRYDTMGIGAWWKDQEFMYSLLSPEVRDAKLLKSFGSISKSIELAILEYIGEGDYKLMYAEFWDVLKTTYGQDKDASRQLAILFSFLPMNLQPSTRLLKYYETMDPKLTPSNVNTTAILANNRFFELLPANYQITYNEKDSSKTGLYFTITPKLSLYEIGISESLDETGLMTVFGPLGSTPLIRERQKYSIEVYRLLGLAGATGCALTHSLVIPLDVVKTRAQTNPKPSQPSTTGEKNRDKGIFNVGVQILKTEGINGLFLGAQATLVGYFWYGISVYPSYTFFKRYLTHEIFPINYATAHSSEIALIAGALAAVVASLGLTPLEAARIRVVAEPQTYRAMGLSGTLATIAKENPSTGWVNLYAGLPSLLTRQVIFGSVKFLAFERASEFIFSVLPFLRGETLTELAVSLVAGGFSGTISSIVSQPADSVLTYVAARANSSSGSLGLLNGMRQMVTEGGPGSLFRGLGSRCIWAGSIIAGQFLLYDVARTVFEVSPVDLSEIYQVSFARFTG